MAADNNITPESIRIQLERILKSPEFRAPDKQRKFLSFVIEETLKNRASWLKGYTIAVAVYGRSKEFDPQVDPIVRVEAGRLRRALERYYLTAGKDDPVRIKIPIGGYKPTFQIVEAKAKVTETPIPKRNEGLPTSRPSVAVMPLLDLTGNKEQDYFVDGLTEEFTTEFTRYQDFKVIASQSTMQFKGGKADARQVGNDLGVRFLLAGSVRKNSKTVKVTIRLIDTSNGVQLWSKNFKRDLTASDLIALQETIAHNVAGIIFDQYGLVSRRLSAESRKKAPSDLRAYDAILRFYHYEIVMTPEAFQEALEAIRQAVEIEPDYGLAWAMLGHLYADNYALGLCEIETPLGKALQFAQRGVALAPENQFALDALTLVHFHRGDKRLFLKHVKQTIALNPNSPYIVGVAGWHMMLYGDWENGFALMKKGMKLNPYHPSWFHLATYMNCYRREEYEEAYTEALKFNCPGLFWDPVLKAAALFQLGKVNEAKISVNELLKLVPDFASRGRQLINRYVKVDALAEKIIEVLQKAGLENLKRFE